jgi:hypothetical protein
LAVGAAAYGLLCAVLFSVAWVAAGATTARGRDAASHSPAANSPSPAVTALADTTPGRPWDMAADLETPSYVMTAQPKAVRTTAPFEMDIYKTGTFVSQINKHTCMAAAVQNMLNIMSRQPDLSEARQIEISNLLTANTTREDSLNGGYGPASWAISMDQLGGGKYELFVDNSLDEALRDAALGLRKTGRPVGLLSWWGAHSWVMTGFVSDGDPRYFPKTFHVNGAFIVDPFYPRLSSIWGQTIGPDAYRDWYDMQHNYIGWKRPEGHYPGRDGKWLLVIPV